jgi:hypothetical protein
VGDSANVQKGRNGRSGTDQGIEGLSLSPCGLASRDALDMAGWSLYDGHAAVSSGPSGLGMVFQPKEGCLLFDLIEPWWKILRSLALAGWCFETWQEIVDAIHRSRGNWNAHRHPFVWGQRRRHRPCR